tara:strand:- start:48 stop:494 length:447 start_codon:yes stop_codon:yes gene_type:complete
VFSHIKTAVRDAHLFNEGFYQTLFAVEGLDNIAHCHAEKEDNHKAIKAGFKAIFKTEDKIEGAYSVFEAIEDWPMIKKDCMADWKADMPRVKAIKNQTKESLIFMDKTFWKENKEIIMTLKDDGDFTAAGESFANNVIDKIGGPIEMQ